MADADLYITADEAAAELGISRATLYSYVSRRGIRTRREEGKRGSLYWKSDILKAKQQRGPITSDKTRSAEHVETALTFATENGPYYRGVSAADCADRDTLEDVAAVLWGAPRDVIFAGSAPKRPPQFDALLDLVSHLNVSDRAAAILPLVEAVNPRSYDLSPMGMALTGADVLRTMAAILVRSPIFSTDPVHLQVAERLGLDPLWTDVVRRLIVLSADNGVEASTYVVRAAASTGLTPYRSVLTGLVVSAGRSQTFGRVGGLSTFLDEIMSGPDPEEPVLRRIREGEALPGFSASPLYVRGDPRAMALLDRLGADLSADAEYGALRRALAVAHDALGIHPDFSLATMFVSHKINFDRGESGFALGRSVGWIAHAIEQYASGRFHRPPLVYTGPLPDQ